MKVKEMIKYLQKQDPEREVVLFDWDTSDEISCSKFYSIIPSANPETNSSNLLSFLAKGIVKQIRKEREE